MSKKMILLLTATSRPDGLEARLQTALEDLGCDVALCSVDDASQALDLLDENRLPVVLK